MNSKQIFEFIIIEKYLPSRKSAAQAVFTFIFTRFPEIIKIAMKTAAINNNTLFTSIMTGI